MCAKKLCECYQIVDEINKKFPKSEWNCGKKMCREWNMRKGELLDNHIKFEAYSDKRYACTCPTCGRIICSRCV